MASDTIVIRIERSSIVVRYLNGETYRLPKTTPDEQQVELLGHLYDCLWEGGREIQHEHPNGDKWFDFLGTRLWQFLHPDLALEFEPTTRRRVLLELGFESSDELLNDAPWELCRFPAGKGRRELLGTSTRLAVSRLLDVQTSAALQPLSPATELRVLMIEASDGAPLPGPSIFASMDSAGINVQRWDPGQVARAIESLEVGRPWDGEHAQFDIIQVLAHGRERRSGEVLIHLSDEFEISGKQLAALTANRTRVVVLQSCSTAPLAASLLASGVEAVVAMLYDIRASRLALFNHAFYGHLVNGEALDVAVQEGRRAVNSGTTVGCSGAPLLFVRNPNPIVFPVDRRPIDLRSTRAAEEHRESPLPYAAPTPPAADRAEPLAGKARSFLNVLASRGGGTSDDGR